MDLPLKTKKLKKFQITKAIKTKKIAQIQTKMEHYISVYWNYCKHLCNAVRKCNYRLLLDICMIAAFQIGV